MGARASAIRLSAFDPERSRTGIGDEEATGLPAGDSLDKDEAFP